MLFPKMFLFFFYIFLLSGMPEHLMESCCGEKVKTGQLIRFHEMGKAIVCIDKLGFDQIELVSNIEPILIEECCQNCR